jgi:hypothetical protein
MVNWQRQRLGATSMSLIGPKRTWRRWPLMSVIGGKADLILSPVDVAF